MAGELHDNAEKQTLAPAGVQGDAASLSQNTQTMFTPMAGFRAAAEPASLDFGSPTDIYGNKDTLAWDPKQAYGDARQNGLRTDIVRVAMPPDIGHPFAGHEMSTVARIPQQAWADAASMFPDLARTGLTADQIQTVSKAILANELEHYDRFDQGDDTAARLSGAPLPKPGRAAGDATLGFSQISENGVRKLSEEFPQLRDYLTKSGYPPGQELKALTDPNVAPALIAANLAHTAKMYENNGVAINQQTLGYGFNPDVSFDKKDSKHEHPLTAREAEDVRKHGGTVEKALLPSPAVLAKSEHAQNIQRWLARFSKTGSE